MRHIFFRLSLGIWVLQKIWQATKSLIIWLNKFSLVWKKWKFSLKNRFFIHYPVENGNNNNPEFIFLGYFHDSSKQTKHKTRNIYKDFMKPNWRFYINWLWQYPGGDSEILKRGGGRGGRSISATIVGRRRKF